MQQIRDNVKSLGLSFIHSSNKMNEYILISFESYCFSISNIKMAILRDFIVLAVLFVPHPPQYLYVTLQSWLCFLYCVLADCELSGKYCPSLLT